MSNHKLWVEKYRPTTISEYIFKDKHFRDFVFKCIEDKSFPHLLLSGAPGTGKTTIAQLLISEIGISESDVFLFNASDKNSVEYVRAEIIPFASTFPMGEFKVVILEEADRLSTEAQGLLKVLMEEQSDNTRFIFTTNRDYKIIPAIKSRLQQFTFSTSDPNDIAEYIATILLAEGVKFTLDLVDEYVKMGYPDIRKIIQLVSQHSKSGTLVSPSELSSSHGYEKVMLDMVQSGKWIELRNYLCANVAAEEWEDVYVVLYKNIHTCPSFAQTGPLWDDAMIIINEHLYKHTFVAEAEICVTSMLCQLNQLQKG